MGTAIRVGVEREAGWMSEHGSALVREGVRGAAARTKSDTMGAREDTSPVRRSGGSLVQRDRRTIARTSLTARDRTNYSVHMDVAVPISELERRLNRLGVDRNKTHREPPRPVTKRRDGVLPLGLGNRPGDDTDAAQRLLGVREAIAPFSQRI